MNFLGHCYLTREYPNLTAGNLGGDFFKGNLDHFPNFPANIINGVRVHRFIDTFTDSSQQVLAVSQILRNGGIQKVSGIACDLLLDHYLAREWNRYSDTLYTDFVKHIYACVDPQLGFMSKDFNWFYERLKSYGWMLDYPQLDGITKIMHQFSRRIPFNNNLVESASIYAAHQKTIDKHFEAFFEDIMKGCEQFILEHQLNIS